MQLTLVRQGFPERWNDFSNRQVLFQGIVALTWDLWNVDHPFITVAVSGQALDSAKRACGADDANPETETIAACMKGRGWLWNGYKWEQVEPSQEPEVRTVGYADVGSGKFVRFFPEILSGLVA